MNPEKWSQLKISVLQKHLVQEFEWGVLVDDKYIFYPSTTAFEIADAFRKRMPNPVVCYTDGSGTTSKKNAGIGVVVYERGYSPVYIAENIGLGTNNRAELMAIWRALKQFPDKTQPIKIYSDSEYAIGSLTLNWSPQANEELIRHIRQDLSLRYDISIEHVDGHSGHEGNELADQLANMGRKSVKKVSL